LKKLKERTTRFQDVGIAHHLSHKERQDIKDMVDEAKREHASSNTNDVENYRFLVAGKGHRRKFIRIRKTSEGAYTSMLGYCK